MARHSLACAALCAAAVATAGVSTASPSLRSLLSNGGGLRGVASPGPLSWSAPGHEVGVAADAGQGNIFWRLGLRPDSRVPSFSLSLQCTPRPATADPESSASTLPLIYVCDRSLRRSPLGYVCPGIGYLTSRVRSERGNASSFFHFLTHVFGTAGSDSARFSPHDLCLRDAVRPLAVPVLTVVCFGLRPGAEACNALALTRSREGS